MVDNVNKVVVHELVKEKHEPVQEPNIRSAVLDPGLEVVKKLVRGIVSIYGSRNNSAHYGVFKEGMGRGGFPDSFLNYSDLRAPTDDDFMELTHVAMERLYEKAQSAPLATGGYIVFADYAAGQGRFFLIAMVKQKPGIRITRELRPEELMQLDLDRLHQAARINFEKLSSYMDADELDRQELCYLSFVSPSAARAASSYFVTALGCAAGASASRATDTLFRECKRFFRETDGLKEYKESFTNTLLAYAEEKEAANESVRLSEVAHIMKQHIPAELADQADELVDGFIARINGEEYSVPVEFPISKTALRKHTHITAVGENWKLVFDRSALGEDEAASIYYNRQNSTVTINRIPDQMRQQIEEELADRVGARTNTEESEEEELADQTED